MPHRTSLQIGLAFSIASGFFALTVPIAQATEVESPRPTMHAVFAEMKKLIPLSLDESKWKASENREAILASLDRLKVATAALQSHGRDREAGFGEIARNLAKDLDEAGERYRLGSYEASRFFLTGSLESCASCHARLPSARDFPFARELMSKSEIDALPPREKASLLVVVRRFDDALSTWEGLISDPEMAASQLDVGGVLVDYLNVAIRVRGAIDRVSASLEKFAAREDLPLYLERRVREWRMALASLDPNAFSDAATASLELGASLARKAGEIDEGPYGRDGLIYDLAAASQLVRWLEQERTQRVSESRDRTSSERAQTALAYYWLGIVETRSLDGFWVNLAERHLEAAIRVDPTGPLAEKAYSMLEESQVLGYGGASGSDLPDDVRDMLGELRRLMKIEG